MHQSVAAARPVMRIDIVMGSLRFDGRASFMSADKLDLALDETTVFVVAAPFSDAGGFRAFLAMNADGQNDYTSGLTLDQGRQGADQLTALNVEVAGSKRPMDFTVDPAEFGRLRRLCVTSKVGPGGTKLYLDGRSLGQRDRRPSQIRLDQLTVGARFYTNGGPPATRGFLAGEIAEVLIYGRLLSEAEQASVDQYLAARYGHLRPVPMPSSSAAARPLPRVKGPPPVQIFAPGFAARRLPLELTNVNNVLYRDDGRLVALTYDGRIFLLRDSDGDGLEDRADVFWDQPGVTAPIGMALTPPGYARGRGVFLASKGRVLLIVDKDGDDRGDEVLVVADRWPEMLHHRVDALGVEVLADGTVYFGLGSGSFTNAYELDGEKQPHYDLRSERGTILKVSPDFKRREVVATGIRFPVAIRANRAGDVFCTDQEGATWLANGNPFDELLHIQPGRHYGFPPRHPRYLPSVIDEPSVFDYTPQHQSTCGFCFNEPLAGGKIFGPGWWADNVFVTGYSRGKLYRTTLVKTPLGYVADNALLASLNMLTTDVCLSPRGELVVATHSGGPDWGSGPAGKGALFQLAYADSECPQPVRAWAASPHEVRIALDRPLAPEHFKDLAKQVQIEYGPNVRAGDRFEAFHPGYAVVEMQMESQRALLPIRSASVTADGRSIILNTEEHAQAVSYAVVMPAPERPSAGSPAPGALPQAAVIELTYNLTGVEAQWQPDGDGSGWTMWLPHFDLHVARSLLAGSKEAERLSTALRQPGKLTLRTQLDLWQMLRPAVQPGSTLDAALPPEEVTVTVEAASACHVHASDTRLTMGVGNDGRVRTSWNSVVKEAGWQPLVVDLPTGQGDAALSLHWHTADDPRPRAFSQRRFFLPWATRTAETIPFTRKTPRELAGGDWQRGKQIFFGEQAQCGKCHSVRAKGGWIGPDLSNLVHRDYASVLRDITFPSYAINPDHLAYTLVLDDGRTLTGMVQTRGESVVVGDIKGVEVVVPRSAIETMTPTLLSIMPEGLTKVLGEAAMRDLLTFLLLPDPAELAPAAIERAGAPPPRSRAEVEPLLKTAQPLDQSKLKPLEIVLVSGPKDHGASEHDYPEWQQRWTRLLRLAPQVKVATAELWPSPEQWNTADGIVIFSANQGWSPERAKQLDAFYARGGGLVLLHYAVNGQRAPEELAKRIGLAWQGGGHSKFRHGPLDLQFMADPKHPIVAGFEKAQFIDESYWNLVGDASKVKVLATQIEEGQPRPLVWTYEPHHGRVFVSIP
ncbi:MAG TPA: ThuA domain-containing protein, partial [Pirellulales bacterium]|nr:ThuA domain-containing protein [Pirellulales bacterium]